MRSVAAEPQWALIPQSMHVFAHMTITNASRTPTRLSAQTFSDRVAFLAERLP